MGITDYFVSKGATEAKQGKNSTDIQQNETLTFPEMLAGPTGASPRAQFTIGETHLSSDIRTLQGHNEMISAGKSDFKDPQFIVVNYLHDICLGNGWLKLVDPLEPCVVKMNSKKGNEIGYRYLPACDEIAPYSFVDCAARFLRSDVCVRVSFPVIHAILDILSSKGTVSLDADHNIQIIETVADLQWVRKSQNCAFIRNEKSLVCWADSVQEVTGFVRNLENKMVDYVWKKGNAVDVKGEDYVPRVTFASVFQSSSESDVGSEGAVEIIGQNAVSQVSISEKSSDSSTHSDGNLNEKKNLDLEQQSSERPVIYIHATVSAFAITLVLAWAGLQFAQVTKEIRAEGNYLILLSLLMVLPYFLFTSFFASSVMSTLLYVFGPISQMNKNSYSYSVHKAPRLKAAHGSLPHVTIQCPVYKEKLESVIKPTIKSLQAAIRTYELQGGSANIFINDDGLQLIDRKEALERIEYYEECGLGYVARPGHGVNGFIRKGRFKKASNMNYCLHISKLVDTRFHERLELIENPTPKEESGLYLKVLEEVVREEGKCWAGGDILLGDIILIIDSDTRVPEDCFVDSVSEMEQSPEVAIIQHASGVMMVVGNYWEKMIAWFTNMIYFSISCVSGNGLTMAAFVGHNAFLRWSAIQELAYIDEDDGRTKYWSESHVSEDFEMTLKLASLGYTIRIATYHDGGFKEGVSLTVYDEITRWSKYAFGCAEIMFSPFKDWWKGKIFARLFFVFLNSHISLPCKFSILGYMGTYYAIATSLIMLVANYFIVGYYDWGYSRVYIDAMKVFVSVMVVFGCATQVAYIIGRYRIYKHSIYTMVLEFRYSILFSVFLGGLSWHMIVSIGSYFFSLNLQWGATAKDIDDSNFFKELPKAIKNYKFMYILCIFLIAGMIVLAFFVPYAFQIRLLTCALPLGWSVASHFLSPIVLNPQLMTFAW
ncbi:CIC11C00000004022 [Sungouiella intermedia]|uniref:CIC11C00000004022 n=1 Tax=Sungouiella intermedia TaxID=45354 RepID=A0A1L0FZD0_9ASCO|nr:CIC11C00000004022 [[Candida] intermedia]